VKIRRIKPRKIIWILIFGVLIVYFAQTVYKEICILGQIKKQQQQLMLEIKKVNEENEKLKRMVNYVKKDEYIEWVAREKLGLVKSNEIIFIDKNRKRKD